MTYRDTYRLTFELSPIILTSGVAGLIPGAMLPIISITEAVNFTGGLLGGDINVDYDNAFAHFSPLPGASIIHNAVPTYPLANQQVAANAIVVQPLRVSLKMVCPAKGQSGYARKTATMLALQTAIQQHCVSGGTFTVCTPSYFYTNCLLESLRDISGSEGKQAQTAWQWDFYQPLLSLSAVQRVQNALMTRMSVGLPTSGALSGIASSVGLPPTLTTLSLSPAASGIGGAQLSGLGNNLSGGLLGGF